MLYAIICEDVPNSLPLRKTARADHLARLETLKNENRLLLAGPHPAADSDSSEEAGFSGSLIVAEFPSLNDARSWAEADPYVLAKVYHNVVVKPFKKVLP